jgi:hypothetical protein
MPKPFCSRLIFSGLFWSSLILYMPNGVFAQSRDSNAIRCWELIVTTPACNSKGILDSTRVTDGKIYHYGNFIMREDTFPEFLRSQRQYRFVSRHRYFVYEKDSIFGFEYKLGIAGHKRKKVTDPGRVSEWELDAGLVKELIDSGKMLYSRKNPRTGIGEEAYTSRWSVEPDRTDTTYFFFSDKFMDWPTDIRLSHGMDSLRHSKLFKEVLASSPHFEKGKSDMVPATRMTMEWAELTGFARATALTWFSRYKADIQTHH